MASASAAPNDASTIDSKFIDADSMPYRSKPNTFPSSMNSSLNLVSQGDFEERPRQDLPSFYPFGLRATASMPSQPQVRQSKWAALFYGWKFALGSWLNILLTLMPASWATNLTMKNSHGVTFALCILVLIPLVRLHDISTRELANRIGGSRTGLLNGTMSNFVEIVVAISALRKCELRVVQSMLIGSMLSKLLLVLGLCFFAGGIKFSEQGFDPTATQIHSSLLSLSVGAVVLPAAYHFMLGNEADASFEVQKVNILKMSHAVSIVLLFIYLSYLIFQLWSHAHLYKDQHNNTSSRLTTVLKEKRQHRKANSQAIALTKTESHPQQEFPRISSDEVFLDPPRRPFVPSSFSSTSEISLATRSSESSSDKVYPATAGVPVRSFHPSEGGMPMSRESTFSSGAFSAASSSTPLSKEGPPAVLDPAPPIKARKESQMSWFLTILLLILVTGAVAVTVDWLVEAMDEISTTVSKEWVGLIMLPAISSIAECITAVRVSVKDELTLSVSVAVGSTIQTALFVIPFTVILAWITNKPLSLLMDPFQSMVLYIAVNTMSYVVADGKSNWLEGLILICLYVIIAVSFWFYPGSNLPNSLATCIVQT